MDGAARGGGGRARGPRRVRTRRRRAQHLVEKQIAWNKTTTTTTAISERFGGCDERREFILQRETFGHTNDGGVRAGDRVEVSQATARRRGGVRPTQRMAQTTQDEKSRTKIADHRRPSVHSGVQGRVRAEGPAVRALRRRRRHRRVSEMRHRRLHGRVAGARHRPRRIESIGGRRRGAVRLRQAK